MNFCHTCHSLCIRSNLYALRLQTHTRPHARTHAHIKQSSNFHRLCSSDYSTIAISIIIICFSVLFCCGCVTFGLPIFIFQRVNTMLPSPHFCYCHSTSFFTSASILSKFVHLVCIIKSQLYSLSWLACKLNKKKLAKPLLHFHYHRRPLFSFFRTIFNTRTTFATISIAIQVLPTWRRTRHCIKWNTL